MAFVNKYSGNKSLTRYNYGVVTVRHKGVDVTTSVGDPTFDYVHPTEIYRGQYKRGTIPASFAHRPDVIAYLFYKTPGYWWQVMLVNNVWDPMEGFNVGDSIILPK
jgi:hypothetical protein